MDQDGRRQRVNQSVRDLHALGRRRVAGQLSQHLRVLRPAVVHREAVCQVLRLEQVEPQQDAAAVLLAARVDEEVAVHLRVVGAQRPAPVVEHSLPCREHHRLLLCARLPIRLRLRHRVALLVRWEERPRPDAPHRTLREQR